MGLREAVRVQKALAHPVRLRLLAMLRGGELCACQMMAALALAASTVSAHLAALERAGLVRERKQARFVYYALVPDPAVQARLEPLWREAGDDPVLREDARLVARLRRIGAEELCRVDLDLGRLGVGRRKLDPRQREAGRP